MKRTTRPAAKTRTLPLEARAEAAFQAAVEKVIEEHARLGLLLPIWNDSKVVEVSADELRNDSAGTL